MAEFTPSDPSGVRRSVLILAIILLGFPELRTGVAQEAAQERPFQRVIVLGFDGADPGLLARYMGEGELPGFKALSEKGCFLPLKTTTPAQSPVSWSTILTGLNPGKTGIFGFLTLKKGEPTLDYALTGWKEHPLPSSAWRVFMLIGIGVIVGLLLWALLRMVGLRGKIAVVCGLIAGGFVSVACGYFLFQLVPRRVPALVPVRQGTPFYELLAPQGLRSVVLEAPMDSPPPSVDGLRMLCGLGVPDITGADASWAVYTSEILPISRTPTGGRVVLLESLEGRNEVEIPGPPDPFVMDELRRLRENAGQTFEDGEKRTRLEAKQNTGVTIGILWKPGEPRVQLEIPGNPLVTLEQGAWSPFVPLSFPVNALITYRGLARFYLVKADSEVLIYQEPIGWDPRHPNPQVPLSSPPEYVKELARKENVGLFETMGWACATNPLKDRVIDERVFVEDVMEGMRRREAMLRYELEKKDWRCLFAVFTGLDRIQHMLWRHLDEKHPTHKPSEAGQGREALLGMYKAMDRIVDLVCKYYLDEDTALLVLSDHGFASFRWGVNLNTWLKQEGYLAVKPGSRGASRFEAPFSTIDWSQTRAVACGLGQIHINVKCGENDVRGIVLPEERSALVVEIANKLKELKHEGKKIVRRVDVRDRVYQGPYLDRAPDLIPGFERGYRVSRDTIYGGVPPGIIEPNEGLWSGDHCSVSPDLVPGIFLSSLNVRGIEASGVDIAPTILSLLGVKMLVEFDGKPIGFGRK